MRYLVVGTAGHIDHGKSSLVRALTGTDPDRLDEEKRRGITIELGFADLPLDDERTVSFVDVPGHERFVRQMVAGATGIDAVLLVVAADEGVQPQTLEHLAICRLLGIRRGLVALTKCDRVDEELADVVALEVAETVAGSFLDGAPVVRTSATSGEGLDRLRETLAGWFDREDDDDSAAPTRLPIDRSFVLRGFGTVITGTLTSGAIESGQQVAIEPGGGRARVRGLQVHGRAVERAGAGQRVAVNLQGVGVEEAARGATLSRPGESAATRRLWARVTLLEHAERALVRGGPIRLHYGTAEIGGRLRRLGEAIDDALPVEIRLDTPAVLARGDRFILRRPAPLDTVGGGVVVALDPPRFTPALSGWLAADAERPDSERAHELELEAAGLAGTDAATLAPRLAQPTATVESRLAALAEQGRVRRLGGRSWSRESAEALDAALVAALERFHREAPLEPGLDRETLRARAAPTLAGDAWRAWLAALERGGRVALEGDRVRLAEHRVALSTDDDRLVEKIAGAVAAAGLETPELDALIDPAERPRAEPLARVLVGQGRLVRLQEGRYCDAAAVEGLIEQLQGRAGSRIDVASFKELTGVSRKYAIPLLEYLDDRGVTRRIGNEREILPAD